MASSADAIQECLVHSLSLDETLRKKASNQLDEWGSQNGFCIELLDIVADKQANEGVRKSAVILLKNLVEKRWRRASANAVADDEKQLVRQRLLLLFDEQNDTISKTHALLLSRVARVDFPREWPDILDALASIVAESEGAPLVQRRAAFALSRVVKALCARVTGAARPALREAAPRLLPLVTQLVVQCGAHVEAAVADGRAPDEHPASLYTAGSKVARRLLAYALEPLESAAPLLDDEVRRVTAVGALVPQLRQNAALAAGHAAAVRVLVLAFKLAGATVRARGPAFGVHAARYAEAAVALVGVCDADAHQERESGAVVAALKLLDSVLACDELAAAVPRSVDALAPLVELLVVRYFGLRNGELETWQDDPETFFVEQDVDAWLVTPRSCATTLVQTCLRSQPQLPGALAQLLARLLADADTARRASADDAAQRTVALQALDACYALCGVAAFELHDHVDFNEWLAQRLAPELTALLDNTATADAAVLQRRVLWLLTEWINDVPAGVRADLCALLAQVVLAPSADLVVRLTAIVTLHTFVRDSSTSREAVMPVLGTVTGAALTLMGDVHELESKQMLLNFVNSIVERHGAQLDDAHHSALVERLAALWGDAAGEAQPGISVGVALDSFGNERDSSAHELLRLAIMRAFALLVHVLAEAKRDIDHLLPTVIALIQYALERAANGDDLLLEHALELWEEALLAAPSNMHELFNLYGAVVSLLQRTIEPLLHASRVLLAYWRAPLADADDSFAVAASEATGELFGALLGGVRADALSNVLYNSLDAFLQRTLRQQASVAGCVPLLMRALSLLLGDGNESALARSTYTALWARALVSQPDWCVSLLEHHQQQQPSGTAPLLALLLDAYLAAFDTIGQLRMRKLACLGLCSLLKTHSSVALARLEELVNVVVDVSLQLEETTHDEFDVSGIPPNNALWLFVEDAVNIQWPAIELAAALDSCNSNEPQLTEQALQGVDPLILGQFQSVLTKQQQQQQQQQR